MLDVVVCALVLVAPVLAWSVYLVKARRAYARHRTIQVALSIVLLLAVALFELDMRLHGGWEQIVNRPGAPPRLSGEGLEFVRQVLWVHLAFAISTPLLWGVTLVLAWRRFSRTPAPGPHSRLHRRLGWIAAADLLLTSATGLAFYYFAFVASTRS
jgi:uncharacterized membrane protein YozB (DUF420 family)